MNSYIPYIIAACVLLSFIALFRKARRMQEERMQILQQMGFSEVTSPDSTLVAQVAKLRHSGKSPATISKAYMRRQGYYTFYLLDIWTSGHSDSTTRWTAAISSSELSLPTFALGPLLRIKGVVGSWLNKAVAWTLERKGYHSVALPPESKCADKYVLYAENPALAKSFFPPSFWHHLSESRDQVMLEGTENLLLFSILPTDGKVSSRQDLFSSVESLRGCIDQADRIFGWFRESGRLTVKTEASQVAGILQGISQLKNS